MCCKNFFLELHLKKSLYSKYSSFLVINDCNQGNTLCSPCICMVRIITDVQFFFFPFSEPCIVIHICEKDQPDANLFSFFRAKICIYKWPTNCTFYYIFLIYHIQYFTYNILKSYNFWLKFTPTCFGRIRPSSWST